MNLIHLPGTDTEHLGNISDKGPTDESAFGFINADDEPGMLNAKFEPNLGKTSIHCAQKAFYKSRHL